MSYEKIVKHYDKYESHRHDNQSRKTPAIRTMIDFGKQEPTKQPAYRNIDSGRDQCLAYATYQAKLICLGEEIAI